MDGKGSAVRRRREVKGATGAPAGTTWVQLRSQYEELPTSTKKAKPSFKAWMEKNHGADYSPANLRRAAERMDSIPNDFTDLLQLLEQLI